MCHPLPDSKTEWYFHQNLGSFEYALYRNRCQSHNILLDSKVYNSCNIIYIDIFIDSIVLKSYRFGVCLFFCLYVCYVLFCSRICCCFLCVCFVFVVDFSVCFLFTNRFMFVGLFWFYFSCTAILNRLLETHVPNAAICIMYQKMVFLVFCNNEIDTP